MTAEEAGYWAGCHKGQTKQISRNEEAGAVGAPINPMKAQSSFYYLYHAAEGMELNAGSPSI